MAKKGGTVQLQADVTNDEEWEKLLTRKGLIIVDVYSEWCGPCSGMSANLKKIKLEVGGDFLHLAMAKADNITVLQRFKDKSEPTWMFIADRQMVQLVFGINSPKLTRTILEELKKEQQCREGTRQRVELLPNEYSDEEKQRYAVIEKAAKERARIENEVKRKALTETRTANCKHLLETMCQNGIVLILPHMVSKGLDILADLWESGGLQVSKKERPLITEEMLEELLYFQDFELRESSRENMLSGEKSLAVIVIQSEDIPGSVDDAILKFAYGPSKKPPGIQDSPAWLLIKRPKKKSKVVIRSIPKAGSYRKTIDAGAKAASNAELPQNQSGEEMIPPEEESFPTQEEPPVEIELEIDEDIVDAPPEMEIDGLWIPSNALVKATALKLFFPQIALPLCFPDPEPTPPHIIMAYDAFKRSEVNALINEFSKDVMNFGFFTDETPEKAKLISKTTRGFEKKAADTQYGEKFILQISKKRSDAVLAFAQIGPSYISPNVLEGQREAKIFFPEGYDAVEEEVVEVKKRASKPRKSKKGTAEILPEITPIKAIKETASDITISEVGTINESSPPTEADKGTSPMEEVSPKTAEEDAGKLDVSAPIVSSVETPTAADVPPPAADSPAEAPPPEDVPQSVAPPPNTAAAEASSEAPPAETPDAPAE